MTSADSRSAQMVLTLGRSGVRTLVDVRDAEGWYQLRRIFVSTRAGDIGQIALHQLATDLPGAPEDCIRFFDSIFQSARPIATVRQLARELGVVPSTLMSRFFRARLPAPKKYLAMARLVHAAQLFENPGLSIATVANRLDYSSPQSFGRHVRSMLHLSAVTLRERYDGEGMLQKFRDELILPYREQLRRLSPIEPRGVYMRRRSRNSEE